MGSVRRAIVEAALHKVTVTPSALASFVTDTDILLPSAVVDITPTQSGSGTPSPTNIRGITGWTGLTFEHHNKNLIDQANETEYPRWINNSDQWAYSSGGGKSFAFPVFGGMTYTVSIQNTASTYRVGYIKTAIPTANSQSVPVYDVVRKSGDEALTPITLVLPSDATYIIIQLGASILRTSSLQVEFGATGTPYVEYKGSVIPVNWSGAAGTVYGGTLDVLTGKLTVTHKKITFDGTENWSQNSSVYCRITYGNSTENIKGDSSCICNMFPNGGSTYTPNDGEFSYRNANGYLYLVFRMNGVTDQSGTTAWKTQLATWSQNGTPLEVVVAYITPIEYTLTPNQIRQYFGINHMWTDTENNLKIDYWNHN